jgi:hypothetical protein
MVNWPDKIMDRSEISPFSQVLFWVSVVAPLFALFTTFTTSYVSGGFVRHVLPILPHLFLNAPKSMRCFFLTGVFSLVAVIHTLHVRLTLWTRRCSKSEIIGVDLSGTIFAITLAGLIGIDINRRPFLCLLNFFMLCFSASCFYLILDSIPRGRSLFFRLATWSGYLLHVSNVLGFSLFLICSVRSTNKMGTMYRIAAFFQYVSFILDFMKLFLVGAIFLGAKVGGMSTRPRSFEDPLDYRMA